MRPSPRHGWLPVVAATLVMGAQVALVAARGALGIARNDDWPYYRTAFVLARTGTFEPDAWTSTMLVGQAWLARPVIELFGERRAPLQLGVAVLAVVGLVAAARLLAAFLSPGWTAVAIGVLALGPLFGTLSVSFMSDVPAFAVQAVALLAAARSLRGPSVSLRWWCLALALAAVAGSIREYALAVPVAMVIALVVIRRRAVTERRSLRALTATALWGVGAVVLLGWRRGLVDGPMTRTFGPNLGADVLHSSARGLVTLAFLVAPLAVLAAPVARDLIRTHLRSTVAVLAGLAALYLWSPRDSAPLLGNYVDDSPPYAVTLVGPSPRILPLPVWLVVLALAAAATGALGLVALDRFHRRARPPAGGHTPDRRRVALVLSAAFTLATVGLVLAVPLISRGGETFDRYYLPALPYLAGLVIHAARPAERAGRRTRVALGCLLASWSVLGVVTVDAAATNDGARWAMAQRVSDQGFAPATVDGGYEWFGSHQPAAPVAPGATVPGTGFWVGLFPGSTVCVTVRYDEPSAAGLGRLVAQDRRRTLTGTTIALAAYAFPDGCRTLPAR